MCRARLAVITSVFAISTMYSCHILAESIEGFTSLQTVAGKVFVNVRIIATEPDGLRLLHDAGVSKIAFVDLPVSLRDRYVYDAAKAAEFAARTAAANRQAILLGEQERASSEYNERCKRAGLPPGFFIPVEGPLTIDQVKGQWLLENVAHLPGFGDFDRIARESAIEYRKQLILAGVFNREAEKLALQHNLEWYLRHEQSGEADVARQRLADMREEETKHAELAALHHLADSIARLASESSWRPAFTYELVSIRGELNRMHQHWPLNVQVVH